MKTKFFFAIVAILGASILFSTQVNAQDKTQCEKKVLRKIKRNMSLIDVTDMVAEGHKTQVILTCRINDNKGVEVVKVKGYDKALNASVLETMKSYPVTCKTQTSGSEFTLLLTFKHIPYDSF